MRRIGIDGSEEYVDDAQWGGVTYGDPQAGPHAGKGPRNYARPAERIHEDVCEALARADDVDASDIEVFVDNGEVTLRGTVTDRLQKRRAEWIAEGVRGVRDVHNHLRLAPLERDRGGT